MSIKKALFAVTLVAIVATTGTVFAQVDDDDEDAAEAVAPPPPPPPRPSAPAPIPVYQVPAPTSGSAEAKAADKSEAKVGFYGTASYRLRGRAWSASVKEAAKDVDGNIVMNNNNTGPAGTVQRSAGSFDYLNLLGWALGAKVKVDDQLSLQFQIGNDLNSGESVSWAANNSPGARAIGGGLFDGLNDVLNKKEESALKKYGALGQNLYVHLAYATWNPGPVNLTGGVIPVVSNGTLDLLERSLSTGSYSEAIFQTWSTQFNNSLIALRLGVPFVSSDELKFAAELTTSVIDPRSQKLIKDASSTGTGDTGLEDTIWGRPSSLLFILDAPLTVGDFKMTPEFTTVINRNWNDAEEVGDHEFIFGLSAGYKVSDALGFSLNGAYGMVSNETSKIGEYGSINRLGSRKLTGVAWRDSITYKSNGFIMGVGSTIKAGPGLIGIDFKLGTSANDVTEYEYSEQDGNKVDVNGDTVYIVKTQQIAKAKLPGIQNKKTDILLDLKYTWNVHPRFSIQPRYRLFYSGYNADRNYVLTLPPYKSTSIMSKTEHRPEIILTGTF